MQKKGYRKSVWCADTSNLPVMSGTLKKRAKNGSWQKRFFCTNNAYLNYYNSSKMEVVKASLDLRKLVDEPHLVDRFGEFEVNIEGKDGSPAVPYRLKADNVSNAKSWVEALTERRKYYLHKKATMQDGHVSDEHDERAVAAADVKLEQATGQQQHETPSQSEARATMNPTSPTHTGNEKNVTSNAIKALKKEGLLQKRSPSRFKAWQDRFFKLDNGSLYYYKSSKAVKGDFLGEIVIDDSCLISHSGRLIKLQTKFRVYELQSSSPEETQQWVDILERLKSTIHALESQVAHEENIEERRKLETINAERLLARQPPDWILKMDKRNEAENAETLQKKLDDLFEHCDGDLITTVNAATSLIEEIEDMARECLPSPEMLASGQNLTESGRIARPDVFEFCLRFYHMRFVQEVSLFVLDEGFKYSSSQDLLRLMDLIVAYSDKLDEVLVGDLGASLRERIATISILTDNVQHMTELYIDRLQRTLGTWIDNIVAANLSEGVELRVIQRSDARVETPAPIDIFNMINETMMMATSAGVEALQAAALSTCLVATADYLNHVVSDAVAKRDGTSAAIATPLKVGSPRRRSVSDANKVGSRLERKGSSSQSSTKAEQEEEPQSLDLRLICALVNDCWAMSEQVDKLNEKYGTHAAEYGIDFEAVHEHYNDAAMALMGMLADVVMGDLQELENMLFTPKHIQEDLATIEAVANNTLDPFQQSTPTVIARVAATLEDYLTDFKALLDPSYFVRASKLCVGHFVCDYCARLIRGVSRKGMTRVLASMSMDHAIRTINPDEIKVIEFDHESMLHCLASTAPPDADIKRLYRTEFLVLEDVKDLLTVTPDFFPASLHSLCKREPPFVWRFVWHVAQSCLRLRADVDTKIVGEIEEACKQVIQKIHKSLSGLGSESAAATSAPGSWTGASLDVHPYAAVWFSLRDAYGATLDKGWFTMLGVASPTPTLNTKNRGLSIVEAITRQRLSSKSVSTSNGMEPGDEYLASLEARSHGRSVVAKNDSNADNRSPRKSVLNAPTDLSDKASRERREVRRNRVSTATRMELEKQIDVDLHGYLDKRSPQGLWQRRWFILRKLFDPVTSTWRQVLAWHKDHTSPPKSHLFVDDIVSVTVSPTLGVVLKPDGITYTLKRSAPMMRKKKGVTVADHEFKIVCRFRVYTLRARSVHDVLTWVNGMKRVCVQNVPRPGNSLPLPSTNSQGGTTIPEISNKQRQLSVQERRDARARSIIVTEKKLRKMSVAKLRGVCSANGLDATNCNTKNELIQLISHAPTGCPEQDELDDTADDGTRSVQEQQTIAQSVWTEERKRMLLMRTSSQLLKSCDSNGVDVSDCDIETDRDEIVERILATERVKEITSYSSGSTSDVAGKNGTSSSRETRSTSVAIGTNRPLPTPPSKPLPNPTAASNSIPSELAEDEKLQEEKGIVSEPDQDPSTIINEQARETNRSRVDSMEEELKGNIRQLLMRGHQFVEEAMPFEAMALFDKAVRESQAIQSPLLEAHALSGLGGAYMGSDERASAAPMMFELAAGLYQQLGEVSGHESAVIDAANAYCSNGFPEQAMQVLERGGGSEIAIFQSKIEEIKQGMAKGEYTAPCKPPKPTTPSSPSKFSETANQVSSTWRKAMRMVTAVVEK